MAFKRKGRKFYELEPVIPGIGAIGRISTGQENKRLAEDMEAALRELALTGWSDLIEQLRDNHVTIAEIWQAKLRGPDALAELRLRKDDPWLDEAAEAYRPATKDERVGSGLDQLKALAPIVEQERAKSKKPVPVRVSWLFKGANITMLYARALQDRRANSVRRSLHRAVAELITHYKDRGFMLAVMANAKVPSENDERQPWLSPEEIQTILERCDIEFRRALGFTLTTGVDRGAMCAMMVWDFDEATGSIGVPDKKTGSRPRRMELDGEALTYVRLAAAGKRADESLFGLTAHQIRSRWEAVREAVGRDNMRWKDLRAVFATYYLLADGSPRELQLILGHSTMAMTMRYLKRLPLKYRTQMAQAATKMGIGKLGLSVVRGGE